MFPNNIKMTKQHRHEKCIEYDTSLFYNVSIKARNASKIIVQYLRTKIIEQSFLEAHTEF